ncbi:hypothetical protein ACE1SV_08420 [Streptomyces sp. E-15]
MQTIPAAPPSDPRELAHCCVVFLPSDPARAGRIGFRRPDGEAPPSLAKGSLAALEPALPSADGGVEPTDARPPAAGRQRPSIARTRAPAAGGTPGRRLLAYRARNGVGLPGARPAPAGAVPRRSRHLAGKAIVHG